MRIVSLNNPRISSYVLTEFFLCIFISLMVTIPMVNLVFHLSLDQNKYRNQEIARMNLEFVMANIQEEWQYAKLNESSYFLPQNSPNPNLPETSSLLSFKLYDGRIIRFYLEGMEMMKDYNLIGKNAVTPSLIEIFAIQRIDRINYYLIQIYLKDKYGNTIFKILSSEKN